MAQKKPLTQQAKTGAARRAKYVVRSKRSWGKRLLMHPTASFALLAVGVLLIGMTYQVAASDYAVNAVVLADPLTVGAVITSPDADETFTTRPITIRGTCPDDSYIKLSRNATFSGAAICNLGSFQIQTDLYPGRNDLQAQDYNISDQAGPVTAAVNVNYMLPADLQSTAITSGTSGAQYFPPANAADGEATDNASLPLLFSSDYHFSVSTTADDFAWNLQYHSAAGPYTTLVDWGDTQKTNTIVPSDQPFTISHRYAKAGYYPIQATGTDKHKRTVTIQLVAFIKKPGDPATNGNILNPPAAPTNTTRTPTATHGFRALAHAWPTYAVIAVMAASFWLGERREVLQLTRRAPARIRLRHP